MFDRTASDDRDRAWAGPAEARYSMQVKLVGAAVLAGVLVMAVTQLAATFVGEPVSTFTREVQVTAEVPWYAGAISLLSGMAWATIGGLALFSAWLEPQKSKGLAGLAVFVLVLAADDALMLHEIVGPRFGVPEVVFYAFYAFTALVLLHWFTRSTRREMVVAFLLGGALLAASIAFDLFLPGRHLLEDGAKIVGAFVWLTVPVMAVGRRPRPHGAVAE